jgi:hypothetical protein
MFRRLKETIIKKIKTKAGTEFIEGIHSSLPEDIFA